MAAPEVRRGLSAPAPLLRQNESRMRVFRAKIVHAARRKIVLLSRSQRRGDRRLSIAAPAGLDLERQPGYHLPAWTPGLEVERPTSAWGSGASSSWPSSSRTGSAREMPWGLRSAVPLAAESRRGLRSEKRERIPLSHISLCERHELSCRRSERRVLGDGHEGAQADCLCHTFGFAFPCPLLVSPSRDRHTDSNDDER